ncbi:MAG: non-homologous end-joining DNA ligase [Micromonosporaceae bacterium]
MLATAGPLPAGPGWTYEFKWDGVRVIAEIAESGLRLSARSGAEVTVAYPELAGLAEQVPDAVLDGEVVVFDTAGRPSFELLAERMHVRQGAQAARLAATRPVNFLIFDLLRLDGTDLTSLPYQVRRSTLEELRLDGERWQVPPAFDDGRATLEASAEHGLEGVMAKRSSSVYRPGSRTPDWVKVKAVNSIEVVVGGWRPGERPLGALLVGVPTSSGALAYKGRVGGGIPDRMVRRLLEELAPLRRTGSPFAEPVPRQDARGAVWVEPAIVVEVAYGNETAAGRLRFPRFVRLRPDLAAEDLRG